MPALNDIGWPIRHHAPQERTNNLNSNPAPRVDPARFNRKVSTTPLNHSPHSHPLVADTADKLADNRLRQKAATNAALCIGSLLVSALCASILLGQTSTTKAAGIPAVVTTRVSGISQTAGAQGRCRIWIDFTGEALVTKVAIFKVKVLRAVDNMGTDLTLPEGENPSAGWSSTGDWSISAVRGWWDPRPLRTRCASLQLSAASPGAKRIADLEGELELLSPTFENGGAVCIENFRLHPGKPLDETRLKQYGVTLTCLNKETYEAMETASRNAPGQSRQEPPASQHSPHQLFPEIPGDPNGLACKYVVLMLNDPQQMVAGFAFRDSDGRLLPMRNAYSVGRITRFNSNTLLPEKLSLLVYLADPKAVEKVPFSIKNIPLP